MFPCLLRHVYDYLGSSWEVRGKYVGSTWAAKLTQTVVSLTTEAQTEAKPGLVFHVSWVPIVDFSCASVGFSPSTLRFFLLTKINISGQYGPTVIATCNLLSISCIRKRTFSILELWFFGRYSLNRSLWYKIKENFNRKIIEIQMFIQLIMLHIIV